VPGGGGAVPGGGGAGAAPDACATLTQAEVQQIVKTPVTVKPLDLSGNASGCEWDAVDETKGIFVEVDIKPFSDGVWDLAKNAQTTEQVPGLGEEAHRWSVGMLGPAGILEIKKAGREIDVTVVDLQGTKDSISTQQLSVANLVLSRV
jgi:hypothetical protein